MLDILGSTLEDFMLGDSREMLGVISMGAEATTVNGDKDKVGAHAGGISCK